MQDSTLISLRKKSRVDVLTEKVSRPAPGIPLNALPGWDKVPLYNKLPMLNSPTAAIVFTRSKVGEGFCRFQSDFDPMMNPGGSPYNALHDPALKKYYSRKRNLDFMKKIGKVTPDNYVVCTLKDFNNYRMLLSYVHKYHIRKAMLKLNSENEDRFLIRYAENAAIEDERRQKVKKRFQQFPEIKKAIKEQLFQDKLKIHKQCLIKYENKLEEINEKQKVKDNLLLQRKYANVADIDLHLNRGNDIARAKIIKLLKYFRFKDTRYKNHMRRLKNKKEADAMAKSIKHWNEYVKSSQAFREKSGKLLTEQDQEYWARVKNHKMEARKKWEKLQDALLKKLAARKFRSSSKLKELQIIKKLENDVKSMHGGVLRGESDVLRPLTKIDLDDAVHTAVDIQLKDDPSNHDYLYKAAKYILERIIHKLRRDLSKDRISVELVYARLEDYFTIISDGILIKVEQVIHHQQSSAHLHQFTQEIQSSVSKDFQQKSLIRNVSFGEQEAVVGRSAWEYDIEFSSNHLKSVKSRSPTPAGSLTSVNGVFAEVPEDEPLMDSQVRNTLTHCNRDERIFAEHFLIKFKRTLIIGVSKIVFEAITKYKNGEKIETNPKLFHLDRAYLFDITAKSILRAGINPFDFESSLRLCINVLANDLIIKLKTTVLRPKFNYAEAKPTCKCFNFGICKPTIGNLV